MSGVMAEGMEREPRVHPRPNTKLFCHLWRERPGRRPVGPKAMRATGLNLATTSGTIRWRASNYPAPLPLTYSPSGEVKAGVLAHLPGLQPESCPPRLVAGRFGP